MTGRRRIWPLSTGVKALWGEIEDLRARVEALEAEAQSRSEAESGQP